MTEPMTQQRLDEIKQRCEAYLAARKGPASLAPVVYCRTELVEDGYDEVFADLASHASRDIPALLAEVERLRAERDEAVQDLEGVMRETMGDDAAITCPLCKHYDGAGECDVPGPSCVPVWIGRKEE